jgi:phosphoserine phosphatase RsbU/P
MKCPDPVPDTVAAPPEVCEQSQRAKWQQLEMEEARRIQSSLLPLGPLRGPNFEIACRFSSFAEVSGDFADYFDLPNGLIGIYVGDVVGKGLSAAMYGAMVMGILRGINKTGEEPSAVLASLNQRLLTRPVSGRFCSTIYATLDPATLELKFSNAGLPFPLRATRAECAPLGDGGLPSGLLSGSQYEVHSVELRPGDSVLFATDGLHEMRDARDEDFSWKELSEIWRECHTSSAEETLDLLFARMKEFSGGAAQRDDITAVVVKALATMVLPQPGGGFARVTLPQNATR